MRTLQAVFLVYLLHHVAADDTNTTSTETPDDANTTSTETPDDTNTTSTETPLQVIARSSNAFTLKMYDVLRKTEGNLFVSPLSLEILLAMVYLGSKGNVSDEIKTALNLPDNNDILKEGFKELIDRAEKSESLEIATRMFASIDFQLKEKFVLDAANYFNSGVQLVDYALNPEEAVRTVNSYVDEKTHNKIKELLREVSSDTALIMVNALYFKADWVHPFLETMPSPFYITHNETVTVDMMSLSKNLNYKHDESLGAQILELPYKGNEYSMLIFLPDEFEGLQSVEDKLANINFEDVINNLYYSEVIVNLPKFRLEKQIELNDILKEMGMTSMYLPGVADLSGIAGGNLTVTQALQKTYINVDEKGTEAAAATELVLSDRCLCSFPAQFFANHPFIFTIVRKADSSVLFMGRFINI